MEIKTKFSIGDKAYYMDSNVVKSLNIASVSTKVNQYYDNSNDQQTTNYSSDIYGGGTWISENKLFSDVDSLLAHVKETSRY